jgi:hypothetical protein
VIELGPDEFPIEDLAEDLYRQVHPNFIDSNGQITSQVFELNSGDDGELSHARSSKTSAENATSEYVEEGRRTCGAVAVTVGDYGAAGVLVIDDSGNHEKTVPEHHCYADFREEQKVKRSVARGLKNVAIERGWAHGAGVEITSHA